MGRLLQTIWHRRELLAILIRRTLKIRYKNSALGFLWSLLTPLLMIAIYGTFARMLRFSDGTEQYLPFLIVGIVIWHFLGLCLGDALTAVIGNANLVKKAAFPRIILPLSMVMANLINFLLTLVVLIGFVVLAGMPLHAVLWLPAVVLTEFALCLGLSLLLSTANVFFRDVEHLLGIVMLGWFFMTPIFYSLERQTSFLPPEWSALVFLNPMTGLVCAYRSILLGSAMPALSAVALSFAVCWLMLGAGIAVFQKCEWRFADEL